ncbi:thiamine pyrophosphate-binding protein [Candidatus Solincola tengchongensis]|uniref:thiamine pyrophosphate-binding protein n=1 Tax=Candidatus Solincola tengchongensis TaxID=2900693 RepID=UPI00257DB3F0|nr:thiamine pyrophosphate-binding protein [Candidatus Solincola tengchongensis]
MGKVHGGHVVAEYLRRVEGVDILFALSGGHIAPIFDGCLDHGVRLVDVRHEQAAVMMAHAWSVYAGKPGVCAVTAGPGFTNSLTGVVNAYLEGAPVVVLAGMVSLRDLDRGALQDMDQQSMVKPAVKWAARCHDMRRIPEYLEAAFRRAVSGRPGPVFLELAPECLFAGVEESEISYPSEGCRKFRALPREEDLRAAADLLNRAERPILLGGSGIAHSACAAELGALVEKAGIPHLLLNYGRGAVPDHHPLSLWSGGVMGLLAAASMADVALVVGLRLNWVTNYGRILENARVIRVDVEPSELDRNRRADVALPGDAGAVLGRLLELVEERDRSAWVESLRSATSSLAESERQAAETPADPIHPLRLMRCIREATGDEAIYIVDGGDSSYFGLVGLRAGETAGVIGNGNHFGCLGIGVPFAIGAKLARPERRVVLVSGDGSFGLNAMEMDTACRHGVPVTAVICNDQAWGMAKHHQEICYAEDRVCGTELGVVRYERMVEALGGHGEFVEREADILPALRRALDSGKPACVNVLTDPTVVSPATVMFAESYRF